MKRVQKKQVGVQNKGLSGYAPFLGAVKDRIRAAQVRATLSANAELIYLYWDIGRAIAAMQAKEGWGAGVIPRLARDIANDMPEVKGFSERNLKRMVQFAAEYPGLRSIGPTPPTQLPSATIRPPAVAQSGIPPVGELIGPTVSAQLAAEDELSKMQQLVAQLPWFHHVLLIQKVKDRRARLWYAQQAIEQGWSHRILALQISGQAYERRGKAVHNFHATLPPPQSDLAAQVLKDPYIFDFLTLAEPFRERELELALLD
jgi:predicted nuclease of restriction endonuclease-like (RecB) superfamily